MTFEINVDIGAADAVLREAAAKLQRPAPLMRAIATELASITALNFLAQGRPHWLGLKHPSARRTNGMILQDTGRLRDSVTPFHTDDSAGVGSNLVYAAIQHLGGQTRPHTILPKNKRALAFNGRVVKKVNHPGSKLPARPFLPMGANGELQFEAEVELRSMAQEYLRSALET
ncbi:phage virion morphogenesis protein [Duganella sp. CY15W]|uniref:phage virion morphogenesis protein n=1 Tax=Duganella sp. CY15W TaxID=2692172 RepID=UPI00136C5F31|nr:phage virion morphogenesis protein [Duganella sp. CY15W]MYM32255.1 phage virion morphogenesis protein [Duganella sp. CY15W]